MSTRLFARQIRSAGPLVVLLHGLDASGRYWRPVVGRLAGEAQIVCPDLLGFGRSPWPSVAYTVADHLAALDATLTELNPGRRSVLLGGHSTGAILALEWAAARPERFDGVALFSLPAYRSAAEAREQIAQLSLLVRATMARPGLGELICGIMCAGRPFWRLLLPLLNPDLPPEVARDSVLHNWVSSSGTLFNVLVNHRVQPAAVRLAATGLPVQLLHGDCDRTAPLAVVQELAGRCGWRLLIARGRTHQLPLEAPEACAGALRTLFERGG